MWIWCIDGLLNKYVVRNKWVYKIKKSTGDNIEHYKANSVAKGFNQLSSIDYYDTFSSVMKHSIIRLVLTLSISLKWNIKQLDVFNAFLHDIMDEKVYIEQLKCYVDENFPEHFCHLYHSLYVFKQASRASFKSLSQ